MPYFIIKVPIEQKGDYGISDFEVSAFEKAHGVTLHTETLKVLVETEHLVFVYRGEEKPRARRQGPTDVSRY